MIENMARWLDLDYRGVLYLGGGLQVARLLIYLFAELDKRGEVRQRILSSPNRNVIALGLGFFWVFTSTGMGPASLAVVTALLGLAASTVWADVRGWEWRLWRRIWARIWRGPEVIVLAPVPDLKEAA